MSVTPSDQCFMLTLDHSRFDLAAGRLPELRSEDEAKYRRQ